ncbi:MAG TPA: ABC transporter permease [Candidatus Scybalocola faecavium]|nr:ABC transporter permease [Candidatus Scybalocola faecavium]
MKDKKSKVRLFFRRLFKRKLVIFAAVLVLFFILTAILAPVLTPYDPYEQDLLSILKPPSAKHWLGTDEAGRDVLTRIFYGARTSLVIGVVSVFISAAAGILLGLISAYYGGIVNIVISRMIDVLMSLPSLMLALALGLVFGHSTLNLMIILGVSTIPTYTRMMSGQVLSIKNQDYIMAERVVGAKNSKILLSHILPNCFSPILVLLTSNIGSTILAESSLSFLGMGINPPTASWGAMVSAGCSKLLINPVYGIAPGICVCLLVYGFNVLGDGLRDVLDPRLRGSL